MNNILTNISNLTYKTTKDIPIGYIQDLFKSIDWKEKDIKTISEYIKGSLVIISVWDNNYLVGLGRATTSLSKEITIWDVSVRPEYQKRGIGSKIMKSLLTILDDYAIPVVTLYAETANESFYKRFGFVPHKSRTYVMTRINNYN